MSAPEWIAPNAEMMSLVATSVTPAAIACTRAGPPPPRLGPSAQARPCLANSPMACAIALSAKEGLAIGSRSLALIAAPAAGR